MVEAYWLGSRPSIGGVFVNENHQRSEFLAASQFVPLQCLQIEAFSIPGAARHQLLVVSEAQLE